MPAFIWFFYIVNKSPSADTSQTEQHSSARTEALTKVLALRLRRLLKGGVGSGVGVDMQQHFTF